MEFVRNSIRLPFYLCEIGNWNDIEIRLVLLDHMQINHEVIDYFREIQSDYP